MAAKKNSQKKSKGKKTPAKKNKKVATKKSKKKASKLPKKKAIKKGAGKKLVKKNASQKNNKKKKTSLKKTKAANKPSAKNKTTNKKKPTKKLVTKKIKQKKLNKKVTSGVLKKIKTKSASPKSNRKKVSEKNIDRAKAKITKADAAKTLNKDNKSKGNTSSIVNQTSKKVKPIVKEEKMAEVTIEKVMEKTTHENLSPKIVKTSETTGFSDSLSNDLSSVFSKTSDELPEPPGKFTMEFNCKASPELLYKFLTNPVELTEWFCDDVNIRNGIYTFVWAGVPQQARLVKQERNISVRFQWVDKNDGSYFEFNIHKNPLTGDVILYVTDFSEPEELESNKLWWTTQINKLKTILGLQY